MISHKARYALRALIALARVPGGCSVHTSEIAAAERIPRKFLEQILLDLKHHGLAQSRRGKHGGYRLLRSAEAISFAEVLRLIDGPLAPLPCLSRTAYRHCDDCTDERTCALRRVFGRAHAASLGVLESMTLADALAAPLPAPFEECREEPCQDVAA